MGKQKNLIGYDLCGDFSQISYYNMEKAEPDSIHLNGQSRIPTALCRLNADGGWLAGSEAVDAAADGKGKLIKGFTDNLREDPLMEVDGENLEKAELICRFLECTLKGLEDIAPESGIDFLTVTMEVIDRAAVDALKMAGRRLGLEESHLSVQNHRLSYEYYALSQRREFWTHDVGMYEYDRRGLRYHHLSISWKNHPARVTVETTDLTKYLDGSELETPVGPEMDRKFTAAIREASAGKTISTYYLVGEGFADAGSGGSWMNVSLQQLCAMRRRVFAGQNLYARGACYGAYEMAEGRRPGFVAVNAGLLMKDIYIRAVHRNTPHRIVLAGSGIPWYSVSGRNQIILDGSDRLVLHIKDILTNQEQTAIMPLEDLPDRPPRTTRLQIETSFSDQNICHLKVTDVGFGEIFAPSGKVWEMDVDIREASEEPPAGKKEAVIESTAPEKPEALDMKLSSIKIYTLEELCWYLYHNVYAITPDFFSEKVLYWMDQVTGGHALTLALRNYMEAGKPLKDQIRLLMNSVDYLTNSEIAYIYNKLTEMERQSPIEQARMAADNYNRYGYYMAALKNYQHVVYQMNHDADQETTRRFKAETWHNMGLTFLKLHNTAQAVECMERAFIFVKEKEYYEALVYALKIAGKDERIFELAKKENIPQDMTDAILARYWQSETAWEGSERAARLKSRPDPKEKPQDYSQFVIEYINNQKKKLELPS